MRKGADALRQDETDRNDYAGSEGRPRKFTPGTTLVDGLQLLDLYISVKGSGFASNGVYSRGKLATSSRNEIASMNLVKSHKFPLLTDTHGCLHAGHGRTYTAEVQKVWDNVNY